MPIKNEPLGISQQKLALCVHVYLLNIFHYKFPLVSQF